MPPTDDPEDKKRPLHSFTVPFQIFTLLNIYPFWEKDPSWKLPFYFHQIEAIQTINPTDYYNNSKYILHFLSPSTLYAKYGPHSLIHFIRIALCPVEDLCFQDLLYRLGHFHAGRFLKLREQG